MKTIFCEDFNDNKILILYDDTIRIQIAPILINTEKLKVNLLDINIQFCLEGFI